MVVFTAFVEARMATFNRHDLAFMAGRQGFSLGMDGHYHRMVTASDLEPLHQTLYDLDGYLQIALDMARHTSVPGQTSDALVLERALELAHWAHLQAHELGATGGCSKTG